MLSKKIKEDFYWVGTLDPDLRVFDIVMETEFGTTYNAYILKGKEKTVLFEAAKVYLYDDFMAKVNEIVPFEKIDILVVNHTEPDHTGTIAKMLELNPNLEIRGTKGAINFLRESTNDPDFNAVEVKAGDELDIGGKTLRFIPAPNLHWPDTMFTYVPEIKTLLTCDCFGAHYSDENITNDDLCNYKDYMSAVIYYYDNILGPFQSDIRSALAKIEGLEIDVIATGHGPVLTKNPEQILELYKEWSSPKNPNEKKTVIIPYVSAYGYTKELSEKIEEGICAAGDIDVRRWDMVYADADKVLTEIEYADGFLLGTPTIVGEALPPIWNLAANLNARIHGGKIASAFGSYGWSGEGVPNIMGRLKQLKLKVYKEGYRVRFKPNEEQLRGAYEYGLGFGNAVIAGKIEEE
jgi:flavorubredoxin